MTAFDEAWRRSREDSMIDPLQQAYDEVDDYENVQHFIHVADPIETFMPHSDKPHKMFRDHLEPTKLVNDEGEYLDSEESWKNMQDDIADLARPRKNRKKSKYARIFVPNPESKKDKIGDFHLDESKSEEWQEKLASEQMTAFDQAWDLVKAPFHGTSERDWDKIVESGGMRPNTFAAGYKGESQIPERVTTTEEEAMEDAWEYALGNVIGSESGTPQLFYINPDHPDVFLDSDDRYFGKLGDVGHVISQADIPLEAIEPVFEGDPYDIEWDDENEWYQRQLDLLRRVLY